MQLEQMFIPFHELPEPQQFEAVAAYRLKRSEDLSTIPEKKNTTKKAVSKIDITDDEKRVLESLGIKLSDIRRLQSEDEEPEPEEAVSSLFTDDNYSIDED